MRLCTIFLFAIFWGILAACSPAPQIDISTFTETPAPPLAQPPASPTASVTPTSGPSSTAGPTPIPTLAHDPAPGRTLYTISAILDYARKSMTTDQTITYFNDGASPLSELLMIVDTNWQEGVFSLHNLRWENEAPIEGFVLNEGILRFPLGNALMPGEVITFRVAYSLTIPSQPGVFGYTDKQINLGNWYPFIPPHNPDLGWLAYRPGLVGEHLSYDISDVNLQLTVLNPPDNLSIAAPARETVNENTFLYELEATRGFALSLSDQFTVDQGISGDVDFVYYTFLDLPEANLAVRHVSVESLAVYQERFGPYPRERLVLVQGDFPDGMEFDGLVFIGREWYEQHESKPTSILSFITAHEVAHQWWYGIVGTNQAMEPWLDEALSTYSEYLYYEAYHPNWATWWWDFRVYFYMPEGGGVDDPIYKYGSLRPYIDAVYLRGALFLDAVRISMGDAAFFAALQDYAQSNRNGEATAKDFFAALEAHSSADLSVYVDIYFGE